ncbi:unnamed protein product [Schistosoma margrebowiei]|uniref:Uncharacterized protein n=1 Tax=Schistosoma margrebowiei TaxID=48269 RepID=A0A183LF53_9TREM|nr:unnamed protein product [Schistosoma margrebowiei]
MNNWKLVNCHDKPYHLHFSVEYTHRNQLLHHCH